MLHHSPTTSRHWATEQFMASKLVRCMRSSHRGLHYRTHYPRVSFMKQLTEPSAPGSDRRIHGAGSALAVLCLSLIVVTIDTTILNVALPTLVDSLHASSSALQWIVDGYTVVFAGPAAHRGQHRRPFGRRGALSVGLAIFGVASAASALATNTSQLIALRALTGVGAALVFPATLSIITNVFPDPRERQRAIAVWAGTAGIGIGLGPVAGGCCCAGSTGARCSG